MIRATSARPCGGGRSSRGASTTCSGRTPTTRWTSSSTSPARRAIARLRAGHGRPEWWSCGAPGRCATRRPPRTPWRGSPVASRRPGCSALPTCGATAQARRLTVYARAIQACRQGGTISIPVFQGIPGHVAHRRVVRQGMDPQEGPDPAGPLNPAADGAQPGGRGGHRVGHHARDGSGGRPGSLRGAARSETGAAIRCSRPSSGGSAATGTPQGQRACRFRA